MKKLLFFAFSFLAVSCSLKEELLSENLQSLGVSVESTKISLKDGVSVWNSGDKVSVFYKSSANELWTYSGSDGSTSGVIQSSATRTETSSDIYAVYPYDLSASLDGNVISTEIPSTQTVLPGSFGKGAAVMVAKSDSDNLLFRFATAFVALRLSGSEASISSVKLRSVAGEKIAGACSIAVSDNAPAVSASGTDEITLNGVEGPIAYDGSDVLYLAAVAPGTYSSGFEAVFNISDGRQIVAKDQMNITLLPGHIRIMECALPGVSSDYTVNIPFLSEGHGYSPFAGISAAQGSAKILNDRSFSLAAYPGLTLDFNITKLRLIWGNNNGLEVTAKAGEFIRIPAVKGYKLKSVAVSSSGTPPLDFDIADESGNVLGADVVTSGQGLFFAYPERTAPDRTYLLKFKADGAHSCFSSLVFKYIPSSASDAFLDDGPQLTDDTIPDFSYVGYKWGEKELPTVSGEYSKVVELPSPNGTDDTAMIQSYIDEASEGTILKFKAAEYRVAGLIALNRSGVVLQGAVDASGLPATRIIAVGRTENDIRDLIVMGRTPEGDYHGTSSMSIAADANHPDAWKATTHTIKSTTRSLGDGSRIVEPAYCGSRFVTVAEPSVFSVGESVVVFRPGTQAWISAINMDKIIKDPSDIGTINQWKPADYGMYWERRVVAKDGNRIFLDNPLVMRLDSDYGMGVLLKCGWDRIHGSGVENIDFVSEYDESAIDSDIFHAMTAVCIKAAEHCWVRNINTRYFSESAVNMVAGAKNITVRDCHQYQPAGYINGGLRYAFHISGGELCLVDGCTSEFDRHAFVTGSKVCGPNVFNRCTSTNQWNCVGPHQRWATGVLFDHVSTNEAIIIQDAGNSGTGQGWTGANCVLWGCQAWYIVCQSPWASAKNYAIGCTPSVLNPGRGYPAEDVLGTRPDGVCRARETSEPEYLYEESLARRIREGKLVSSIARSESGDDPVPSKAFLLDLDFSTNSPFTEKLPTYATTVDADYMFSGPDGKSYSVTLHNITGGYDYKSSSLRFNDSFDGDGDGWIKLPAVAGKILDVVYVKINNTSSKPLSIGTEPCGQDQCAPSQAVSGSLVPFFLNNPSEGQSYYLNISSKNTQFVHITLKYI